MHILSIAWSQWWDAWWVYGYWDQWSEATELRTQRPAGGLSNGLCCHLIPLFLALGLVPAHKFIPTWRNFLISFFTRHAFQCYSIISRLKSLSVSLHSFTHLPTAFHDLLSVSHLFFWVTRIGTVVTSLKKVCKQTRAWGTTILPLSLVECSQWQWGKVVVVETVPGVLHRVLAAMLGWHLKDFGRLGRSSNGLLQRVLKVSIWRCQAQGWILGTGVAWDLESSSIVPVRRNIFNFRL